MIDARKKMKTLCMRYGVARGWTEYGKWIILGVLGTKGAFLVLVSYGSGYLRIIRTWSCLPSPFGPFGIKGTRYEPNKHTVLYTSSSSGLMTLI